MRCPCGCEFDAEAAGETGGHVFCPQCASKMDSIKAISESHKWDGPLVCLDGPGMVPSCSVCGADASADWACRGEVLQIGSGPNSFPDLPLAPRE